MKTIIANLFILLLSTFHLSALDDFPTVSQQTATEDSSLKASSQAAAQWLELVDQGKFNQSWDTGSLTFKLTIPKSRWEILMNSGRKPLGTVTSRQILDQRTSKDPKGLPKGDYMVIFYNTNFSNKNNAHELVTMVQESDGNWRVLTYQVQ